MSKSIQYAVLAIAGVTGLVIVLAAYEMYQLASAAAGADLSFVSWFQTQFSLSNLWSYVTGKLNASVTSAAVNSANAAVAAQTYANPTTAGQADFNTVLNSTTSPLDTSSGDGGNTIFDPSPTDD